MTPDMWTCLILFLIFIVAIIGAMKIVRTPRYCHRCAEKIDGTPVLEDKFGNCWHFECWQMDQKHAAVLSEKIEKSKLPT